MNSYFKKYAQHKEVFYKHLPDDIMSLIDSASENPEIIDKEISNFVEKTQGENDSEQLISDFVNSIKDTDLQRFYNITVGIYSEYTDVFDSYNKFMNVFHFLPVFKTAKAESGCGYFLKNSKMSADERVEGYDQCIENKLRGYAKILYEDAKKNMGNTEENQETTNKTTNKTNNDKQQTTNDKQQANSNTDNKSSYNNDVDNIENTITTKKAWYKTNTTKFIIACLIILLIAWLLWKDKLKLKQK